MEESQPKWGRLWIALAIIGAFAFGATAGYMSGSGADAQANSSASTPSTTQSQPVSQPVSQQINLQDIPAGMYLVGTDIPAGEYKLIQTNSIPNDGFVNVQSTPNSGQSGSNIISQDVFNGQAYVTLKKGEYVQTDDAYMKLIN